MIRKSTIINGIFFIAVCYIIGPWFFEKKLLFNEILSAAGFFLLLYKRFRLGSDTISVCMLFLFLLGAIHAVFSLYRMDSLYYYLRNTVIVYSMMTFFIGYYCLPYLSGFVNKVRRGLQVFIGTFIVIPLPRVLFERFGVASLFPALFSNPGSRWVPYLLIIMNIIYALVQDSFTGIIVAGFYFLIFISPGYKFFSQVLVLGMIVFTVVFIYLQPNLSIISRHFDIYSTRAIHEVMDSHPLLSVDGNSTWRLVLWKEILVDNFPNNLLGLGFGTPILKYYPIEDITKVHSLPYVLGAHNSFVYLFGRLGIGYVLLIFIIYISIFKEYFYYKAYYYRTKGILIFWSFFAVTIIALFNPVLESPIYASSYWLILGFVAKSIHNRQLKARHAESPVYT